MTTYFSDYYEIIKRKYLYGDMPVEKFERLVDKLIDWERVYRERIEAYGRKGVE